MRRKLYKDVPEEYPVCQLNDCPKAKNCLRQLAYAPLMKRDRYLKMINPAFCTKDEKCTFFRESSPVIYARGFKRMQENMLPKQYDIFMRILKEQFGHNQYYERRRGNIPIPPEEQKIILAALKEAGINKDFEFDTYEENIRW